MTEITLGAYEIRFKERAGSSKMHIYSMPEGSVISKATLNGLTLISNNEEEICFKNGWFTHSFKFQKFVPGVYKASYIFRLFGKLPIMRLSGEIGEIYKNELRLKIEQYS